jgi:hypothetical protein
MPFRPDAAAHRIVGRAPHLRRLGRLAGGLRAGTGGAALTLSRPRGPIETYAICMATLTLLTAEAERRPVLAVVDDAGRIDRPSLSALLFAARQVAGEPVAIVLAARDPVPPEIPAAGVELLPLTGLDQEAAGTLLETARPGRIDPAVRAELWTATGGNPRALTEAGAVLTDEQLAGEVTLPDPLPLGAGLCDAFAARVAPLPAATRLALLAVALAAASDAPALIAALDTLGIGAPALAAAVAAGLLAEPGARIALTHPLLRAAIRQTAPPGERRRVYDAGTGSTCRPGRPSPRRWASRR